MDWVGIIPASTFTNLHTSYQSCCTYPQKRKTSEADILTVREDGNAECEAEAKRVGYLLEVGRSVGGDVRVGYETNCIGRSTVLNVDR